MQLRLKPLAAIGGMILTAACTTTGVGMGTSRTGDLRANFSWIAHGPTEGDMSATMSDGRGYSGRFFQITSQTLVQDLSPLWIGWGGRSQWRGWGYWGPSTDVVTHYSGQVLANLNGPGGYMRCHFRLVRPSAGMSGGGQGNCQLPDGARIRAMFE